MRHALTPLFDPAAVDVLTMIRENIDARNGWNARRVAQRAEAVKAGKCERSPRRDSPLHPSTTRAHSAKHMSTDAHPIAPHVPRDGDMATPPPSSRRAPREVTDIQSCLGSLGATAGI
jgi:hypothetical protein